MQLVGITDEAKQLMDANRKRIKDDYRTYTMFIDSAVKAKLRNMGAIVLQDDAIIAHLRKLESSKARHVDQTKVKRARKRHELRVRKAKERMELL